MKVKQKGVRLLHRVTFKWYLIESSPYAGLVHIRSCQYWKYKDCNDFIPLPGIIQIEADKGKIEEKRKFQILGKIEKY